MCSVRVQPQSVRFSVSACRVSLFVFFWEAENSCIDIARSIRFPRRERAYINRNPVRASGQHHFHRESVDYRCTVSQSAQLDTSLQFQRVFGLLHLHANKTARRHTLAHSSRQSDKVHHTHTFVPHGPDGTLGCVDHMIMQICPARRTDVTP